MARRLRRRVRKVPRQRFPDPALATHEAFVARLVRELNTMLVTLLIGNVEAFVDEPKEDGARMDARSPAPVVKRIFSLWTKRVRAQGTQRRFKQSALAADRFNRGQIARQLKTVLNVNLKTAEPFVAAQVNAFAAQNTALITKMGKQQLSIASQIVRDAQAKGTRVEVVAARLEKRLAVTTSRAMLIARDQVNKLNSQLTEERHKSNGIERYIWRTSQDDLVRDEHQAREGNVYSYAKPPPDGNPGEPIQCRCFAEPIIDDAAIARLEKSAA